MANNRPSLFATSPVTMWLIVVNFACWFLDFMCRRVGLCDFAQIFGLNYLFSGGFHFWQPITYMFMHGGFDHIFFNMFALLMFGAPLEQYWGRKRYLIYYFVTGVGAGIVQELVWLCMYGVAPVPAVTIGASGAIFGVLLAFGWLFPDVRMFILFIPIPIRARIFVIIYAVVELFLGLGDLSGDNVAHFAHLGGMLFGLILILIWRHKGVEGFGGSGQPSKLSYWWRRKKNEWQNRKDARAATKNQKDGQSTRTFHYQDPVEPTASSSNASKPTYTHEQNVEIERILNKIKLSGYDSLTAEEKQKLFDRK